MTTRNISISVTYRAHITLSRETINANHFNVHSTSAEWLSAPVNAKHPKTNLRGWMHN